MANKFASALRATEIDHANTEGKSEIAPQQRKSLSRKNAKHVGGYFAPAVSKQLRQIALNEDTSTQALIGESLNMLFESRGMPQIAFDSLKP